MKDQGPSEGHPSTNYSFGIKLREDGDPVSPPTNHNRLPRQNTSMRPSRPRSRDVDPNISLHIEGLIKEYLKASAGMASSRDIGRYLAANAAFGFTERSQNQAWNGGRRQTALQQLKDNYGSLASYLSSNGDTFATVSDKFVDSSVEGSSQHAFGVKLIK